MSPTQVAEWPVSAEAADNIEGEASGGHQQVAECQVEHQEVCSGPQAPVSAITGINTA